MERPIYDFQENRKSARLVKTLFRGFFPRQAFFDVVADVAVSVGFAVPRFVAVVPRILWLVVMNFATT